MEPRTLQFLVQACDGKLVNARKETTFTAVSPDSRQMSKGVLFWALIGDRFDGHDFVATAIEAGAVAAVVAKDNVEKLPKDLPLVVVKDTREALGKFGARYREDFSPTVI